MLEPFAFFHAYIIVVYPARSVRLNSSPGEPIISLTDE